MNIQAYILNISGVKTFDEFMEIVGNGYMHTVEAVLSNPTDPYFTAPKWIMDGDIVFFCHAKQAKSDNNALRKFIKNNLDMFEDDIDKDCIEYLDYFDDLYKKYGGKIYAVGRICGNPIHSNATYEFPHFRNKIFAPIKDVIELQCPIKCDSFSDFLQISRHSGITPVLGNDFTQLKNMILKRNDVPILADCFPTSTPIKEISSKNWLKTAQDFGRRYVLEYQFRKYYVDYFLFYFRDGGKVYSECTCYKGGRVSGIADNFILFNGKYVAVEVKLNINAEKDLIGQVKKYCNPDTVSLSKEKPCVADEILHDIVFVIDTYYFYLYDDKKESIEPIESLDNIKCMTNLRQLKGRLIERYGI